MMKPRDISQRQLWVEDLNTSLSSLESFSEDASDDESEDEVEQEEVKRDRRRQSFSSQRMLPRLGSKSKRPSNNSNNSKQGVLRRRATFHDGCSQQEQQQQQQQVQESLRYLTRLARGRGSRGSNISLRRRGRRHTTTTTPGQDTGDESRKTPATNSGDDVNSNANNGGVALVSASPMRKFRMGSHISDSALSASRSCHSQRRRVSQANAKWDISNNAFQSRRGASLKKASENQTQNQPSGSNGNVFQQTINESILGASSPRTATGNNNNNNNNTETQSSAHCRRHCTTGGENDSGVGSRETRWSTSTHTRDAVICPRRQNSGLSIESCDSSACSCNEEDDDDDVDVDGTNLTNPGATMKREEEEAQEEQEEPKPVSKATLEEEQQEGEEVKAIEEQPCPIARAEELITTTTDPTAQIGAFLATKQNPGTRPQIPHRQKSFTYSMEDAIQEAIAAQSLEDFSEQEQGWATLPVVEFPQMVIPRRRGGDPTSDSLVSLMNPFQKPRSRPLQAEDRIKSASSSDEEGNLFTTRVL